MKDLLVDFLLFLSGVFILLAALGLKRFPDLYCRMHATAKAATMAKVLSAVAAGIYFWDQGFPLLLKLFCIVLFYFLSSPIAAHLIARAGYKRGATPSDKTWHNDYS